MRRNGLYFYYDKISYWKKRKYYRFTRFSFYEDPCEFHSFGNTWCCCGDDGKLDIRINQCSADMVTFFEMNNISEKGIIGGQQIYTSICCFGDCGAKEFIEHVLSEE